jgi:hypothetical protein
VTIESRLMMPTTDQRGLEQATHHVGERDALALAPTEQNCDSSGKPP